MTNTCISCGAVIPEGRLVCPNCENKRNVQPDAILKDGTPLYFKSPIKPTPHNLQAFLYQLINGRKNK